VEQPAVCATTTITDDCLNNMNDDRCKEPRNDGDNDDDNDPTLFVDYDDDNDAVSPALHLRVLLTAKAEDDDCDTPRPLKKCKTEINDHNTEFIEIIDEDDNENSNYEDNRSSIDSATTTKLEEGFVPSSTSSSLTTALFPNDMGNVDYNKNKNSSDATAAAAAAACASSYLLPTCGTYNASLSSSSSNKRRGGLLSSSSSSSLEGDEGVPTLLSQAKDLVAMIRSRIGKICELNIRDYLFDKESLGYMDRRTVFNKVHKECGVLEILMEDGSSEGKIAQQFRILCKACNQAKKLCDDANCWPDMEV
jgi:hypothetical protein